MSYLDAAQKWKLQLWLRWANQCYLTPFWAGLNRGAIKQPNLSSFSKVLTIIISCQGVNRHKHDYIYSCKHHLSLLIWQVSIICVSPTVSFTCTFFPQPVVSVSSLCHLCCGGIQSTYMDHII